MRNKIISIGILGAFIITPNLCFADSNYEMVLPYVQQNGYQTQYPLPVNSYQTQGYNHNQLQGNVVMVPPYTTFSAISSMPISSETAKIGDAVIFYLGSDFYYGSNLIACAGSNLNGIVTKVNKGGIGNRNGQIQIRFTNIVTPSNQIIPLTAHIKTNDGTGILKAGTAKDVTKEYAKDAVIGAAAGAALGTAMGALSGGKVGRGAIYGTAVGGGMGLMQNVFERGGNIDIPQNAQMDIILEQAITVSSNNPY